MDDGTGLPRIVGFEAYRNAISSEGPEIELLHYAGYYTYLTKAAQTQLGKDDVCGWFFELPKPKCDVPKFITLARMR
jgi:hypothetical protein